MWKGGDMVTFLKTNKPGRPAKRSQTTISISSAELEDLGELLSVGQSVLKRRAQVAPRLKAAMTRLGLQVPTGL
jgi:hypothetical protein